MDFNAKEALNLEFGSVESNENLKKNQKILKNSKFVELIFLSVSYELNSKVFALFIFVINDQNLNFLGLFKLENVYLCSFWP